MISFTENAEDHLKKTIVEGEIVRVAVLPMLTQRAGVECPFPKNRATNYLTQI
jgi:hypothetical protein